ncbi:hypothetical protein EDB84DRAFT_1563017 [Lactarius hengduanensis]|nr:hypothetical protein EDB84DRAFT_1563017 [Lactarius hengduanensis]
MTPTLRSFHNPYRTNQLDRRYTFSSQADLFPLVDTLLKGDIISLFLLSRRGHGLGTINMRQLVTGKKTAAMSTMRSPTDMIFTDLFIQAHARLQPHFDVSKIAVVTVRLIINGEDGNAPLPCSDFQHPFTIPRYHLHPPAPSQRRFSRALDFSMTRFNKIKSPPTALLGDSLEAPSDARAAWWDTLWRIPSSPTKTESSSPGDVLALCIRHGAGSPSAATPSPYSSRKDSLLAEHAHALLEEGR